MSENPRAWTVLIYFAADNDLEADAINSIIQLLRVGSSDKVHVLAQFDGLGQKARRIFVRGRNDGVVTPIDEPNTGSVEALVEFVRWGSSDEHKADNYLLVIWGHGSGIDDDEDDVSTAKLRARLRELKAAREAAREASGVGADVAEPAGAAATPLSAALGGPKSILFGGIGDDSTTQDIALDISGGPDSLTLFELRHAFEQITDVLGKKVAIYGMDACLMSMIEVAQQVSESADLVIGSEEVIPSTSWPYEPILRRLVDEPTLTPRALSEVIIDEYVKRYAEEKEPVALSACRLDGTKELARALGELGSALGELTRRGDLRRAVTRARRKTQTFRFRDYIDLFHFCEVLQQTLDSEQFKSACEKEPAACRAAREACGKVMQVIKGDERVPGFVVHSGNTAGGEGGALENARGVSIYFPPLPPTYAELALNECARWDTFLHGYINAVFRPLALRAAEAAAAVADMSEPASGAYKNLPAAPNGGGNGHSPKARIGGAKMSSSNATDKRERLALPPGSVIKGAAGEPDVTLENQAFLVLGAAEEIGVPVDTELDIPVKGKVKASSGTSTKAPGGTRTDASVNVELTLPACTLTEPFSGGGERALAAGTKVRGPEGDGAEPIIVLAEVTFRGVA